VETRNLKKTPNTVAPPQGGREEFAGAVSSLPPRWGKAGMGVMGPRDGLFWRQHRDRWRRAPPKPTGNRAIPGALQWG